MKFDINTQIQVPVTAQNLEVYLDGNLLNNCVEADSDEGKVLCYITHPDSNQVICDEQGNPLLIERTGKVTLKVVL